MERSYSLPPKSLEISIQNDRFPKEMRPNIIHLFTCVCVGGGASYLEAKAQLPALSSFPPHDLDPLSHLFTSPQSLFPPEVKGNIPAPSLQKSKAASSQVPLQLAIHNSQRPLLETSFPKMYLGTSS